MLDRNVHHLPTAEKVLHEEIAPGANQAPLTDILPPEIIVEFAPVFLVQFRLRQHRRRSTPSTGASQSRSLATAEIPLFEFCSPCASVTLSIFSILTVRPTFFGLLEVNPFESTHLHLPSALQPSSSTPTPIASTVISPHRYDQSRAQTYPSQVGPGQLPESIMAGARAGNKKKMRQDAVGRVEAWMRELDHRSD